MRIFRNLITISSEIVILVLSILWYVQSKEYEPLIAIIASAVALLIGLLSRSTSRPRLVLHHKKNFWGRSPRGYTKNNPQIIRVGIDQPEQYWELNWNYELEIRNNSSQVAYSVEIEYIDLPPKTYVDGEIGKIEPLKQHEMRVFSVRLTQNITGTHVDADNYLESNEKQLTAKFRIKLKYRDEAGTSFYTNYIWVTDENKHPLLFG